MMSTPEENRRSSDAVSRSPSANRHRTSLSYLRKKKVRKSLKFDTVSPPESTQSNGLQDDGCASLSTPTTSQGSDAGPALASLPSFWSSPPPLAVGEEGTSVNRRSLRLRTKSQFAFAQISDSQSPNLHSGSSSISDQVLRNKTLDGGFDGSSVHSDYGTASSSENSLYFHPNQFSSLFCSSTTSSSNNAISEVLPFKKYNVACRSSTCSEPSSQSIGFVSDLDDCMSNLSIDDAQKCSQASKQWDSDDNFEDIQTNEWEDSSQSDHLHINLNDLNRGKLNAFFKTYEGINILAPLNGYEVLRLDRSVCSRTNNRRNVRYHLRRRPCPQLENLLKIQVFNNINIEKYFRLEGLRICQVSPVISIQPHEVKFCALYPAIVQIPLQIHPSPGDEVHCLYSRYSTENLETDYASIPWKSVEAGKFSITGGRANFETYDFGLFVLIIRPKSQYCSKRIRARVGGKIIVNDLPGVEITFPKEATDQNTIEASAKIYLDTEESVSEILTRRSLQMASGSASPAKNTMGICGLNKSCLATPIIQLEPHGIQFQTEPVMVTLPIPDYERILALGGDKIKFRILQSNTGTNEPSKWESLDVEYEIVHQKRGYENVSVVTFPVYHFSFFKGVWDALSNYLYDARVGMMYYFVSFAMKCQANMEEYIDEKNKDNPERRFGLEVSLFQADKPWPAMPTYKYKVGQSNPKLVKPGRLCVKLKSQYFGPDVDAGEEESLVKEEIDFRGRDFEKQFACKFKPEHNIERGPFGKVWVTRQISPRQKEQQIIFEFNIQKHGNETEISAPENNDDDRWSIVALTELAHSLFITEGENWRVFAKEIGMTKQEILDAKLKSDPTPFKKIVNHYKQVRGGTADEFVNAIYRCHRSLKIQGGYSPESSKHSRSSNGSSGRGSLASNKRLDRYGSHDSDTSGTQTSQDSGLPPGRKRSHPNAHRSAGNNSISSSKLSKRRRLSEQPLGSSNSDVGTEGSDTDSDKARGSIYRLPLPGPGSSRSNDKSSYRLPGPGSSRSNDNESLNESVALRNDNTKLFEIFLWDISEFLNTSHWRALGRSLGLEESVLIDVDHSYKSTSFRECAYQMLLEWRQKFPSKCTYGVLYSALIKEKMNGVAKTMSTIQRNGSD